MSSILSRAIFPKTGESPFAPQNGGAKPIARRRTKSPRPEAQGRKGTVPMEIRYAKSAVKALESLDRPTKARIRAGIHGLTQKPPLGDIKAMQGYHDGRFRLRVGKYRIVYRYGVESQLEILYIMDIGSRGDIYKK
jgi:mRNA interferase RelE/StbE